MNKKERRELIELVVGWEFIQGGSVSEAAAYNRCGHSIKELFKISNEEMAFDRAWEIAKLEGDTSDNFVDAVLDLVEEDYEKAIDLLECKGALAEYVKKRSEATP